MHMETRDIYDITIIGAGPTGLFGAFYAGMRHLRTKIIEALPEPGGQLGVLYPEKIIYDVPGYSEIRAGELVRQLMKQISRFPITFRFGETMEQIEQMESGLRIHTDKAIHYTRALVITSGIGAFAPTKLKAENAEVFEGQGLSYYLENVEDFRGKRTLVVGGGEQAIGWALQLDGVANQVTLIHHKSEFRAEESQLRALEESSVVVRVNAQVKAIQGDGEGKITGVTLFDPQTKETDSLAVEAILINLGYKSNLKLMHKWGVQAAKRYIPVTARMETNIPGVYAAGGVAAPEGADPLDLISTGFGQAAIAVNHAAAYIDPRASVFPGHSSEGKF